MKAAERRHAATAVKTACLCIAAPLQRILGSGRIGVNLGRESPAQESPALVDFTFCSPLDCHGRGREFESRRPRHSFFSAVTGASKETHVGYRAGFAMTGLFTARNESRLDELAAVFAQDELLRFLLLVPVVERKAIREVYAGVHF